MKQYSNRTYVGNGTKGKYSYINFSVCVDKLVPHVFDYQGKKYVKLTIAEKKETDQYGKTHTVFIDEKADKPNEPAVTSAQHNPDRETVQDLPF